LIKYYVYILANKKNGTLYTGFTSDISRRMQEHKNKVYNGFTKKYEVDKLVYVETFLTSEEAMVRERRIKKWCRKWKVELIERNNPDWKDLTGKYTRSLDSIQTMDSLFRGNGK